VGSLHDEEQVGDEDQREDHEGSHFEPDGEFEHRRPSGGWRVQTDPKVSPGCAIGAPPRPERRLRRSY
jgi:hypothetical protein